MTASLRLNDADQNNDDESLCVGDRAKNIRSLTTTTTIRIIKKACGVLCNKNNCLVLLILILLLLLLLQLNDFGRLVVPT